jgi:hypothetical protein
MTVVPVVLLVAFLLDSACAAACLPERLETREEHCAPENRDAGCDQHGHLKPAVKKPAPTEVLVSLESPAPAVEIAPSPAAPFLDPIPHVPPLLKRSSVLRI